ncbi:MAG: NAD(P)H-quinone oxidoreductase [marine benthic group bacterium]|nr:NAD(P)H-quinone oxidoreductase [Gemmatimonadota bacterium]MCL7980030.1 NAD(P)H-quinone oxidoreductase [Gemmatimonadota bacterium]
MKAIRILRPGDPDVLELVEVDPGSPGPGELGVSIHATAVNRADLLQRRGGYPAPPGWPTDIPGLEFAGIVEEVGEGVDESVVGSWVMGLLGGGGYAEHVVTGASQVVRIPAGLQFIEAAALPEAFFTAYDALVLQGGLKEGMTVLVHAAGSGVGTAALQVAKTFGASRIFGTASAGKLAAIAERGLPLDVPIDYTRQSFRDVIRRETAGQGVDLVLDLVGATYWSDNVASLAPRGTLLLVGLMGGTMAQINLGVLMRRRLTVIGTVLRSREPEEKAALTQRVDMDLSPLFASGELESVVDRVFPLARAADAHAYVEENRNLGKVMLRVRS